MKEALEALKQQYKGLHEEYVAVLKGDLPVTKAEQLGLVQLLRRLEAEVLSLKTELEWLNVEAQAQIDQLYAQLIVMPRDWRSFREFELQALSQRGELGELKSVQHGATALLGALDKLALSIGTYSHMIANLRIDV